MLNKTKRINLLILTVGIILNFSQINLDFSKESIRYFVQMGIKTARRIRGYDSSDEGNISREKFQKRLSSCGLDKKSIDNILGTIDEEFSTETGRAQDTLSSLAKVLKDLNLNLGSCFESIAIQVIEGANNNIRELQANTNGVIFIAKFLIPKLKEDLEVTLKSLLSDAFNTSKGISNQFRDNIRAIEALGNRLEKFGVDFKMLRIISDYSSRNSLANPEEYRKNLGHIGGLIIGGLKGERKTETGLENKIGERFALIEERRRPDPEEFLNKYLPLIDKVSWQIPTEFRSNLNTFAFNTAELILKHISPEPIMDIAYSYAKEDADSPEKFRSYFTQICTRTISLEIEDDSGILLPYLMKVIINVSEEKFKFLDKNVGAVRRLKEIFIGNGIEIIQTLLTSVKASALASGNIAAQFRINLGEKEGIGYLVMELKRKGLDSQKIENILIDQLVSLAEIASKEAKGEEIAVRFRELLKQILSKYP